MITIKLVNRDGVMVLESPIPADALRVCYGDSECVVYQPGDEPPPEPDYGE